MTVTLRNVDDDFLAKLEKLIFPRKDIVLESCYDTPNEETIAAMLEGERLAKDPSAKTFSSVEDLFEDLRS